MSGDEGAANGKNSDKPYNPNPEASPGEAFDFLVLNYAPIAKAHPCMTKRQYRILLSRKMKDVIPGYCRRTGTEKNKFIGYINKGMDDYCHSKKGVPSINEDDASCKTTLLEVRRAAIRNASSSKKPCKS